MFAIRRSTQEILVALYATALLTLGPCPSAMSQQGAIAASPDQETPYTFHVTKSEVVVDLIAVDAQNRSVLNLVPADLEIFDEADGSPKKPKVISSLRLVDPSSKSAASELPQSDFLGVPLGSCRLSYTVHYQLAYSPGPDGSVPGIHTVQIQARRRGVRLSYRHGYFINPPESEGRPAIVAVRVPSEEPVNATLRVGRDESLIALGGNSFGTTVPNGASLCGDVYEISEQTKKLPDYHRLTPIGMIYTNFLAVTRDANVIGMGLPNITTRTEWVGLDYFGRIWIARPGTYKFQMISDDGARLEIDGKSVIDLDGIHPGKTGSGEITLGAGPHEIHIPYFNGPRAAVLMLYVEAPGGAITIFNTLNFAPAARESAAER